MPRLEISKFLLEKCTHSVGYSHHIFSRRRQFFRAPAAFFMSSAGGAIILKRSYENDSNDARATI